MDLGFSLQLWSHQIWYMCQSNLQLRWRCGAFPMNMVYVKALGTLCCGRSYWVASVCSLVWTYGVTSSVFFRIRCHSFALEFRVRLENFISTQHVKKKPAAKQFWPVQCWNLQWILQRLACQGHEMTILATSYKRVVTCGQKKYYPLAFPKFTDIITQEVVC